MDRKDIIKELKSIVHGCMDVKKKYSYVENIDKHVKDLKNIIKVLSSKGNLRDIQNASLYNLPAYFKMDIPKNMSIKQFIDLNKNDISLIKGVRKFGIYAGSNSITAKYIWIKPINK